MAKKKKTGELSARAVLCMESALARVLSLCRSREDLLLVSKMLGGLQVIDHHCTMRHPGLSNAKVVYILRGCQAGRQKASDLIYEAAEVASMGVKYAATLACHEYISRRQKPVGGCARDAMPPIAHVCDCLESLADAMRLYAEINSSDRSDDPTPEQLREVLPAHWLERLPVKSTTEGRWLLAWYQLLLRVSGSPGLCALRHDAGSYNVDVGVQDANWQVLNSSRDGWRRSSASLQDLTSWMARVIASPKNWAHHDAGYAALSLRRTHHRAID